MGMLVEKSLGRHHKARRAKTALLRVIVDKRLLNRMEGALRCKALNRGDLATLSVNRKHGTRIHGLTVHHDRTSATRATIANPLRASRLELIEQSVQLRDSR